MKYTTVYFALYIFPAADRQKIISNLDRPEHNPHYDSEYTHSGSCCSRTSITRAKIPKAFADQAINKIFKWYSEECTRERPEHVSEVGGTNIETSHLNQIKYTAVIRVLQ